MDRFDAEYEQLSKEVHQCYCRQYALDNGKPYWTNGDYNLLDEKTKEYDRNIVDWHLAKIEQQSQKIAKLQETVERLNNLVEQCRGFKELE